MQLTASSPLDSPAPLIDKQSLMEKLELIPAETLRSILSDQVDLEIRLKHKEFKLSEEEIGKCEAQMVALRQFFEVPNEISFRNEPSDFTLKYYDILNRSLSVNYTKLRCQQYAQKYTGNTQLFLETEQADPPHSYRTRSTTSSLRPSIAGLSLRVSGCIYRRTDGIIVRLTCPDCHRSNFSSAQGFLNHNRIAHSKEFASQDDAAIRCGEILPEEFQDEEGLASLAILKEKALDGSSVLNVNEAFFEGFVKSNSATPKSSVGGTSSEYSQRRKSTSRGSHLRANSFLGGSNDFAYTPGDGSKELMKKLIKDGVAENSALYKLLVDEFSRTVPNSHLFDNEEEEEEEEEKHPPLPPLKLHIALTRRPALQPAPASTTPLLPRTESYDSTPQGSLQSHTKENQLSFSDQKNTLPHPESGGKYENRLRRRRPRSDASDEGRGSQTEGRRKRRR